MKASILKLSAAGLFAAVALLSVSCSSDDGTTYTAEQIAKMKYAQSFEAKYGKVSASQSWDFSSRAITDETVVLQCEQPDVRKARATRAESSAADVRSTYNLGGTESDPHIQISVLNPVATINELSYIRAYAASTPVKNWTPEEMNGIDDMWVWYAHGFATQTTDLAAVGGVATFSLGIHYFEPGTGSHNAGTEYFTSLPIMGTAISNNWFYGYSNTASGITNAKVGQRIDASRLTNSSRFENYYWYALVDDGSDMTSPSAGTIDDAAFRAKWELKTYKELTTPTGAVYWLFDCNHDGDYTDLVCLVEPSCTAKRYMVEDLGSIGDFDFNDVVVDVLDNGLKQWAVMRAMGGTLDFTVRIGNTEWNKSENGFSGIKNTQPTVDYSKVLATFDVTGWDPASNNITVTVENGTNNGVSQDRTVTTIPFPKAGEVPMIIAVNPAQTFYANGLGKDNGGIIGYWMDETVSIPASLWTE